MTVRELAGFLGFSLTTLYEHRYRGLVAQENGRRVAQQDPRPAIEVARQRKEVPLPPQAPVAKKGRGGESRLPDIVAALRRHPGGGMTAEELASLAGVGTRTLYTHNVHQLVIEDNARRAAEGLPLIEWVERPRPSSLPLVVEALRNHPGGFLTRGELVGLTGISDTTLDAYQYHNLIEEENARRAAKGAAGLPPIQLVSEFEKAAISAIAAALREHPGGRLTLQRLAILAGMSHSGVLAYDYHGLIAQENAWRAAEEPERPPIRMTRRVKEARASIMATLRRHPGGPLTAVALAESAGVGVHNLYFYGWRDLVAQENALREAEEPRRPAIEIADEGAPRTLPVILAALRRHPGGRVTLGGLADFSQVSTNTLIALDYRRLIAQENARRVAEEPQRLALEGPPPRNPDALGAVIAALREHPGGPLTEGELLTLAEVGQTTLSRMDTAALVAQENANRQKGDPPRMPITMVERQTPRVLAAMARALRAHPGGRLTHEQWAQGAGISKDSIGNYDYRSLVMQENALRVIEKRPLLEPAADVVEAGPAIADALRRHPGGPLTVRQLADQAQVSQSALFSHNYRDLIAQENKRQAAEVPERLPIIVPAPPRQEDEIVAAIAAALQGHPGGQLSAGELAALADVHLASLESHNYQELIAQENLRRLAEDPPRPAIELFVPSEHPALDRILDVLLQHPGGPLTAPELVQQADVSRATLTWNHYRELVDQENTRRQREEPPRPAIRIVVSTPPQNAGLEEFRWMESGTTLDRTLRTLGAPRGMLHAIDAEGTEELFASASAA